ncbi:SH3 domain-containing protein [Streptomyces sp. NPDC092952]|uniref:SH3 domain-containing protein n=1 Tax=Streptomyces sp. NPDC092952 TaxID=3366018 RepID=UPI003828A66B
MNFLRSRLGLAVAAALAGLMMMVGGVAAAGSASAAPASSASEYWIPKGLKTHKVTASALRFRASPNGRVKGLLFRGDRVFIRESYVGSPWVKVVLVGKSKSGFPHKTRGWVHRAYLKRW